ncbi:hypothetical protein ACFL09_05775, partial [Planctomycetota bacterium]
PTRWYKVKEHVVLPNAPSDAVSGPTEPPGAPLFVAISLGQIERAIQLPGAASLTEEEQKRLEAEAARREAAERAELEILKQPHRVFVGPGVMSREWFDILCPPRPSGAGGRPPYVSLIHPEYITRLTRQAKGDTTTGTVAFEAKDAFRGKVTYIARHGPKGWRVVEFRLPVRGIGTRLQPNGMWKPIRRDDRKGKWIESR